MRMNNKYLLNLFMYSADEDIEVKNYNGNLYIRENKLYNYNTCIAYKFGNEIILNMQKYNTTTSRHQNYIMRNFHIIKCISTEKEFISYIKYLDRVGCD